MLNEYVGWESFEDPLMTETLLGGESFSGVPLEALRNETYERIIRHIPQLHHNVL